MQMEAWDKPLQSQRWKKHLQVEVSQRLSIPPTAAVLDVSAVLWTVTWPVHGTVDTFIHPSRHGLPDNCKSVIYISALTITLTIQQKVAPEQPKLQPLEFINSSLKLPNATVLKTSANKEQLNALISNEILNDDAFLKSATASHKLVVTGEKTNPV